MEFIGYLALFLVPPLPFPLIHASYVLCALHLGSVNSIVLECGLSSSLMVLEWIMEILFFLGGMFCEWLVLANFCRIWFFQNSGMNEKF